MELTKEHFEKHLSKELIRFSKNFVTKQHFDKQVKEINGRMDNMATKNDLKQLEEYTNDVRDTILEALNIGFDNLKNYERITYLKPLKKSEISK